MKIRIELPKPRNRFVALAHARRAGAHRSTSAAGRQQASRLLRRELAQLKSSVP